MNALSVRLFTPLLLIMLLAACQDSVAPAPVPEDAETTIMDTPKEAEKLLRHVVIFKFKDEASEADVERLNLAFNALADEIPVIKDFEWGINDSPENFHQDFTHCYLLTFESEEARDSVYTPHPQHQAFVQSLGPHLEKVFVVDYWTNP